MREDPRPSRWKSPWPWIGLSCAVLILGGAGVSFLVLYKSYQSYQDIRDRIRNESPLVLAEITALKDPNVKVDSRDTELHTVTLRNQKTGERFVLEQTREGKLRIRTEAGEVVLDISRPHPHWVLWLGSAGPMPPWVPAPPGAQPSPLYSLDTGDVVSGCSLLIPSGPVEDVLALYRGELEEKGFKLVPGDLLSASSPDFSSSIFVTPTEQKGRSGLLLTWSAMAGNPENPGNP